MLISGGPDNQLRQSARRQEINQRDQINLLEDSNEKLRTQNKDLKVQNEILRRHSDRSEVAFRRQASKTNIAIIISAIIALSSIISNFSN